MFVNLTIRRRSMSTTRFIGLLLLVGGIVLLLLSLSADMIGLGRDPGFGYQQMAGFSTEGAKLLRGCFS